MDKPGNNSAVSRLLDQHCDIKSAFQIFKVSWSCVLFQSSIEGNMMLRIRIY